MRISILYAPENDHERLKLRQHLASMQNIEIWDNSDILSGTDIEEKTKAELQQSDYVLFLMSPDSIEKKSEILRSVYILHKQNKITIIPIFLRWCLWQETNFSRRMLLPKDKQPIFQNNEQDESRLFDVVRDLRKQFFIHQDDDADLPGYLSKFKRPKNPYPGINWFTKKDASIYFGRNEDIDEFIDLIHDGDEEIILLFGKSGVGKSSFLHAGIVPRLEYEGYTVKYIRRLKKTGLNVQLANVAKEVEAGAKYILIFDQLEEIFNNPNPAIIDEEEQFFSLLANLIRVNSHLRFILGFREEHLATIRTALGGRNLEWEEHQLEALKRKGVMEAITGITRFKKLRRKYKLSFSDELPLTIAADVLADKDSNVAPFLQMLLRDMWDEIIKREIKKNLSSKNRNFDNKLYQKHRSGSFENFISRQLEKLAKKFPKYYNNGLCLDLLSFFVTEKITAGTKKLKDLKNHYDHIDDLDDFIDELKKLWIISDAKKRNTLRLSHDSLASIITKEIIKSDRPGQRATKILDNILEGHAKLTKTDFFSILNGMAGRRKLTAKEQKITDNGEITFFKEILKKDVRENNIDEAIKKTVKYAIANKDKVLFEKIIYLSFRNQELKRISARGILSYEKERLNFNQLTFAFQEIINPISTFNIDEIEAECISFFRSGQLTNAINSLRDYLDYYGHDQDLIFGLNNLTSTLERNKKKRKDGLIPDREFLKVNSICADSFINIFMKSQTQDTQSWTDEMFLEIEEVFRFFTHGDLAEFTKHLSSVYGNDSHLVTEIKLYSKQIKA
ncbi:MAG: TIR domain-containing protein, partial [Bacteroidota bacterium]